MKRASDSLKMRLTVGSIATLLFLFVDYFAIHPLLQYLFLAVTTLVSTLSLWEFYQLTIAAGYRPQIGIGIFGTPLFFLSLFFQNLYPIAPPLTLFILLVALFILQMRSSSILSALTATLSGFGYVTLPLSSILLMVSLTEGRLWLFYLIAVTKSTDIGGYIVGKMVGKRLLAPTISPKKTVEGAIGGLLFSTVASVATAQLLSIGAFEALLLGLFLSLLAQISDLSESMIKREAKVKDSNQLPGFGGMLDIVDSLLFTAPALYFYLQTK